MNELDTRPINDWVAGLLFRLRPDQRRLVNRSIATGIRRSQRERIAAQTNPDGTPFQPRKKNLRAKQGHIKRKSMFVKLRTLRHLKMMVTSDDFAVGFVGRNAQIAAVHQDGAVHTSRRGRRIVTPRRELLGWTIPEVEWMLDAYIEHIAGHEGDS